MPEIQIQPRTPGQTARGRLDIVCMIPSLRAGGSERVLAGLANEFAANDHGVTVLSLMEPGEAPFYKLTDRVTHTALGGLGSATSLGSPLAILDAARRFRATLGSTQSRTRPRIVLGFATLGAMMAVLATRGMGLPVVAAERVDPGGHGRQIGRVRAALRDMLHSRADHVVVQTARARQALAWLPDARISCIPNAVYRVAGEAEPDHAAANGRFRLIAAGRLDMQKGFDLLIAAFAGLADRFPSWDLVIHGDGPQRRELEAAIAGFGLASRIRLPGVTAQLDRELLAAHLLAFPSRYEGFPNALAEGMAAGLPAVGFRGVSGVEDLIVGAAGGDIDGTGEATGLLAEWVAPVVSLADRLAVLMANPDLRRRLGGNARQHVAAFTPQIHYEQWESLLTRIAGSRVGG